MARKEPTFRVTIKVVPHPNPEEALDLMARVLLKQIVAMKETESNSQALKGGTNR